MGSIARFVTIRAETTAKNAFAVKDGKPERIQKQAYQKRHERFGRKSAHQLHRPAVKHEPVKKAGKERIQREAREIRAGRAEQNTERYRRQPRRLRRRPDRTSIPAAAIGR